MSHVLDSYLVALGFDVNATQAAKFQGATGNALKQVTSIGEGAVKASDSFGASMLNMVSTAARWQASITGAVVGVASAFVTLADKIAMADQRYRLYALRMYVNPQVGRGMFLAQQTLGESLDNIAWDRELHGRFMTLIADQSKMQRGIGGDFEQQMRRIRDMRFELQRFMLESKYVAMGTLNAVMKALGSSPNQLLTSLRKMNEWIIKHIPDIAAKITKYIVPVLRDVYYVGQSAWRVMQGFANVFVNLIGILSGDNSLKGTVVTFDKVAKSMQYAAHWVSVIVQYVELLISAVTHLAEVVVYTFERRFKDAAAAGKAAALDLLNVEHDVVASVLSQAGSSQLDKIIGSFAGSNWQRTGDASALNQSRASDATGVAQQARAEAERIAPRLNLNPKWIWSQWAFETGGFRSIAAPNNLGGIRYPGSTDYQRFGSVAQFADRYADIISSKRYRGIKGSRSEQEFVARLKAGGYMEADAGAYFAGVRSYNSAFNSGGTTQVSAPITVNVPPSQMSHAGVASAVHEGVESAFKALRSSSAAQRSRDAEALNGPFAFGR